ncbi:tape measure protein [Gordonia phage Skog]|uniref:Tape measure protein n=1 Tax=Gordonia phage Skog TaxID=2704033 RepID=A0A6G6XKN6_9CAUD|nr:tail length tape measure protein [Gordonia phage Skog]QIG58333.1 tape measure protein [Gordonia phage Skog]
MTGPSGGFEYQDESVIAKISVDVPPQAATELADLASQTRALRIEMEALSRAQGSWSEHVAAIPEIAQRAAQGQQALITQLERTAYIQRELGGSQPNVGAVGSGQAAGAQERQQVDEVSRAPQQQYNTSAPAGYVNPFHGMLAGLGMQQLGMPSNLQGQGMGLHQAQQYLQGMGQQDPRLYANMMAQRGHQVDLSGIYGGPSTQRIGSQPAQGPQQAGQGGGPRQSQMPPDATQGGAPTRPLPPGHQQVPESGWQRGVIQGTNAAQQILSETTRNGSNGSLGRASRLLGQWAAGRANGSAPNGAPIGAPGGPPAGPGGPGGPGGGGGGPGSGGPGGGEEEGGGGPLSGITGKLGVAGTAIAAGAALNKLIQGAGEEYVKYQQLGSVQGGGFTEGVGHELAARVWALDPTVTKEQARIAKQVALSAGFRGQDRTNVEHFIQDSFEKYGLNQQQSGQLAVNARAAGDTPAEKSQNIRSLAGALEDNHALAEQGGASVQSRNQQFLQFQSAATSAGASQEDITKVNRALQSTLGKKDELQEDLGRISTDMVNSPHFLTEAGSRLSPPVLAVTPSAQVAELSDKGKLDEAIKLQLQEVAKIATNGADSKANRAGIFRDQMSSLGVQLDYEEAEAMLEAVSGKDFSEGYDKGLKNSPGRERAIKNSPLFPEQKKALLERERKRSEDGGSDRPDRSSGEKASPQPEGDGVAPPGLGFSRISQVSPSTGISTPSVQPASTRLSDPDAQAVARLGEASLGGGNKVPGGMDGNVSGELRIVVDQSGKVTAPPSIKLSGHQTAVNYGMSGSGKNDPPPGDRHADTGWSA